MLRCLLVAVMLWAAVAARSAAAQELEPGAYSVSPVGVNLFNAGYTLNTGDVTFDPALPVQDGHARIHTLALSLGRAISLAGRSATLLVTAPVIGGHVEGLYRGDFTSIDRTGLGDLRVRFGVNVYGAPALRMPEFARNPPPPTTFSVGLTVVAPTGQYDSSRIINLGSHRWSFKPETAVALKHGPWMVELYGGAWLFTANDDFFGGQTRTQDALLSTQANVRYTFRAGLWLSGNANFYTGGRTSINGRANLDFQRNSRLGTTLTIPTRSRSSFRLAVSKGAYTTIGSDFLGLSFSYQRAF